MTTKQERLDYIDMCIKEVQDEIVWLNKRQEDAKSILESEACSKLIQDSVKKLIQTEMNKYYAEKE